MPFYDNLARFHHDESGTVTIDWVVLTSACLGLGMAVVAAMSDATESANGGVTDRLEETGASRDSGATPERSATSGGG